MKRAALVLAGLLACAASSMAQGIIIVPGPPVPAPDPLPPSQPVFLRELRLSVRIEGQTAVTRIEHTFYNPTHQRLEGTFVHPLPRDAAVTNFSLWVGGVKTPGEVLPREQARSIYEDIVRRARDPGLLEFIGTGLVRARIFPIEPRSEQKVEIEYAEVLRSEAGLSRYAYPLNIHRDALGHRFRHAVLDVQLETAAPLRSVYSPSHDVEIKNDGQHRARVGYESSGRGLDTDFVLYFSVSPQDVAVHLLAHRSAGTDGTFLLLVSPPRAAESSERLPKDVVFVVDTSGSMREQDRISQAKRALVYGLRGLGERDRFNLVTFGTGVYPMADALVPATRENVERALGVVESIVARGGTHVSEALLRALRSFEGTDDRGRPRMIVFLSDGKPTVGVTQPDELLALVEKHNQAKVRFFCFGVGVELSTRLLDRLAADNYGTTDYVDPKAELELAVSSFFDKVDYPALSDVEIRFEGVEVRDLYPSGISDLFFGEQLVLLGRYRKPGRGTVVVRGWKEDKQETYTFENLDFADSARHEFVPRLWAARRIGHLLDEIRRNGEDRELVDEIVELGQRYGIPSPYASYLVVEDAELDRSAAARRQRDELESLGYAGGQPLPRASEGAADASAAPQAAPSMEEQRSVLTRGDDGGAGAVAVSKDVQEKQRTSQVAEIDARAPTRQASGLTFYQRGPVWVQAELLDPGKPGQRVVRIQAMGKGYFELAAQTERLRELLAVGGQVRFLWNDVVVEVGPEGEDELSAETRKLLGLG